MHSFASRTLSSRITVAIGFLAALAVCLFVAFAWFAALKVDEEALRKEKVLIRHALASLILAVPREQESFSVRDDAVIHTAERDLNWITEEFSGRMYSFFGHDRTYIVNARNELLFAADAGAPVEPPHYTDPGEENAAGHILMRLRDQLADRFDVAAQSERLPRSDIYVADVMEIGGRPAVVSARPILPHTERLEVADGAEHLFLSVKFLDGAVMAEIANRTLVSDLRYEPALYYVPQDANVRVRSAEGSIFGYYLWTPEGPGLGLIKEVAPWAVLALALCFGVGFHQARGLQRASLQLHASESRARHLAFHDALTGLPNRAMFEDRLEVALKQVRRGEGTAAVLLLDLDRFKNINDTLGHRAGDQLVRQAAARLDDVVGQAGTVARIGGDEFAIVLAADDAAESAGRMGERLLAALMPPFQLDEEMAHVGASIGIAIAPAAADRRDELLRKADIALYEAKKHGRGRCQFFSETMDDIVKQRRQVEADLRKALTTGNELELVYQPLYGTDAKPTGAEALLRWNHPVHHAISPGFLIQIAEECGLIMQIGDWVLHEACRMARRVPVPWISVNVSPMQLRDPHFARRCLDIVERYRVAPNRIQIEITEAVVIQNPEITAATLCTLKSAGMRIALDDFGTGYSSMSYLQNYPLDRLKIDRFFVRALSEGEEAQAIVAAMIQMADALKLEVTAEGVETPEQRELLVRLGCREMQGYLFSKPVTAAELVENVFPAKRRRA